MLHSSLCTPFYLSPGLLFGWRKLTNQTAAFLWALSEVDPARGGGRNKYNTGFGKQFTLSTAGLLVPKQGRSQREASLPRDAGHSAWPPVRRWREPGSGPRRSNPTHYCSGNYWQDLVILIRQDGLNTTSFQCSLLNFGHWGGLLCGRGHKMAAEGSRAAKRACAARPGTALLARRPAIPGTTVTPGRPLRGRLPRPDPF